MSASAGSPDERTTAEDRAAVTALKSLLEADLEAMSGPVLRDLYERAGHVRSAALRLMLAGGMATPHVAHGWVTAFMDILGSRAKFGQLEALAKADDDSGVSRAIAGLVVPMEDVRRAVDEILVGSKSDPEKSPYFAQFQTEGQRRQFKAALEWDYRLQFFSDSAVLSVPFLPAETPAPCGAVWSLLAACAVATVYLLARGVAMRGGVEVGYGVEYFPGEVTASSVAGAYAIESTVAKSPRVVIGDKLMAVLKEAATAETPGLIHRIGREMARDCLKEFITDDPVDGKPILHYLSPHLLGRVPGIEEARRRAHDFVVRQREEWSGKRGDEDRKVASKFEYLLRYFNASGLR